MQAFWSRCHLWRNGCVHKLAPRPVIWMGSLEAALHRRSLWSAGPVLSLWQWGKPETACVFLTWETSPTGCLQEVTFPMGELPLCLWAETWAFLLERSAHYGWILSCFPFQLEGAFPDTMTRCAELLNQTIEMDFVDINVGCPIDLVYKKVTFSNILHPFPERVSFLCFTSQSLVYSQHNLKLPLPVPCEDHHFYTRSNLPYSRACLNDFISNVFTLLIIRWFF